MEKALQLVFSQQARDVTGDAQSRKVPSLRPACVETSAGPAASALLDGTIYCGGSAPAKGNVEYGLRGSVLRSSEGASCLYNSNKSTVTQSPPPASTTTTAALAVATPTTRSSGLLAVPHEFVNAISPQNSPSVLTTGSGRRLKLSGSSGGLSSIVASNGGLMVGGVAQAANTVNASAHADPTAAAFKPAPLLKSLAESSEAVLPSLIACEGVNRCGRSGALLGVSDSSESLDSPVDADAGRKKLLLSDSGESKEEKATFFKTKPRLGTFTGLIEWLLHCGETGEITTSSSVSESGAAATSSMFSEDFITKLCAAATAVLAQEPTLLELEVHAADTLVVVGDIHGQFQDLYTSVLCQQYDRRRCNPGGLDRHFLFMGDYVDRGPHSLEVVLLLLALKVEYPTLVYLTRGNHEEEKTSRVYGFLTEATSSLGAAAGAAVWSAVNKVFLDLPLATLVTTPRFRFLVMHGGLSPALQTVDQIAAIDRHAYNTGELSKEAHDIVDGLLWSDPAIGIGCFAASARGCGWSFGPAASTNFCTKNRLNFICRAHQLAMDGYFWTHNDRVVTVFSAPNYCGINDNRGAVMVVNGNANKPSFEQYEYYEDAMEYGGGPSQDFPYSSYFC